MRNGPRDLGAIAHETGRVVNRPYRSDGSGGTVTAIADSRANEPITLLSQRRNRERQS